MQKIPVEESWIIWRQRVETHQETILIVEDNYPNRKLIETVLRPHGYRLLIATNGIEAVELACREKPDLILMDLQLPMVSGYETTRQLKNIPDMVGIPVVALTAHVMAEDRQQALAYGCAGFIAKPINTRTFPSDIRQYFQYHKCLEHSIDPEKHGL
jgi:two-component system, cell cycle response regulator DivK